MEPIELKDYETKFIKALNGEAEINHYIYEDKNCESYYLHGDWTLDNNAHYYRAITIDIEAMKCIEGSIHKFTEYLVKGKIYREIQAFDEDIDFANTLEYMVYGERAKAVYEKIREIFNRLPGE